MAHFLTFLPWSVGRIGSECRYAKGTDASRQHQHNYEHVWSCSDQGKTGSEHKGGADDPAQKGNLRLVWGSVGLCFGRELLSYCFMAPEVGLEPTTLRLTAQG